MDSANRDIIDKVHRLKIILTARTRTVYDEAEDREYESLRADLVPILGARLPGVVKSYRTLPEFRRFIQRKLRGYAERDAFITEEFSPLLIELEGLSGDSKVVESTNERQMEADVAANNPNKKKTVFVVYGRNSPARIELFAFLRALHLHPLEWGQVRKLTGKGSPYVGEILAAGFKAAQAAVVLFTPDDEARLREPYLHQSDGDDERQLNGQPRQNVLFEAGMAMGQYEERTILVELGKLRPMSDVVGRYVVRLDDTPVTRNEFVHRLKDAGCDVNDAGGDWYHAGRFNPLLEDIKKFEVKSSEKEPIKNNPPLPTPPATDDVPPIASELDELSPSERRLLIELRRPGTDDMCHADSVSGEVNRVVEGLLRLKLLIMSLVGYEPNYVLTSGGKLVADRLWENMLLQAIVSSHRSKMIVSMDSLAKQFDFDLSDGTDARGLRRHLKSLNKRGLIQGNESKIELRPYAEEELRTEGLGMGT